MEKQHYIFRKKKDKRAPLACNYIHLHRYLIWTHGFLINHINGISDLIPAENIKYLKNCFGQILHY